MLPIKVKGYLLKLQYLVIKKTHYFVLDLMKSLLTKYKHNYLLKPIAEYSLSLMDTLKMRENTQGYYYLELLSKRKLTFCFKDKDITNK